MLLVKTASNKVLCKADAYCILKAGWLYIEQGNRKDALRTLQVMKQNNPDSPLIQKIVDKLYEN